MQCVVKHANYIPRSPLISTSGTRWPTWPAQTHSVTTRESYAAVLRHYYVPAPMVGGIKWWCLSDVWRLSVAYNGPNSRTERPRKTKIGTEVVHVTRDSDTTFKVKRSKVNLQGVGSYCGGLPHSLLNQFSSTSLSTLIDDLYAAHWRQMLA